jgi:hypothetical protein
VSKIDKIKNTIKRVLNIISGAILNINNGLRVAVVFDWFESRRGIASAPDKSAVCNGMNSFF